MLFLNVSIYDCFKELTRSIYRGTMRESPYIKGVKNGIQN